MLQITCGLKCINICKAWGPTNEAKRLIIMDSKAQSRMDYFYVWLEWFLFTFKNFMHNLYYILGSNSIEVFMLVEKSSETVII